MKTSADGMLVTIRVWPAPRAICESLLLQHRESGGSSLLLRAIRAAKRWHHADIRPLVEELASEPAVQLRSLKWVVWVCSLVELVQFCESE